MKRILIFFVILSLVPIAAYAQQPPRPVQRVPPPPPMPPPPVLGKWWKNAEIVRTLELSEAQVAQLESVYLLHQPRLSELRSALMREEERLRELIGSDQLDERAISTQKGVVSAARTALAEENTEMTLAMRRVVTAEQWRKFEKLRKTMPPVPPPPPPPPPPPGVSGGEVYEASTPGLKLPEPVFKPLPPYTQQARMAKIEGIVLLQVVIRADGRVDPGLGVRILSGLGYGLDESALKTVTMEWRFQPGMLNGIPVNVRANVEISFRLK